MTSKKPDTHEDQRPKTGGQEGSSIKGPVFRLVKWTILGIRTIEHDVSRFCYYCHGNLHEYCYYCHKQGLYFGCTIKIEEGNGYHLHCHKENKTKIV